ncbi:hypothetical protein P7770_15140, partial [Staphylococcus aureus]|nr:hypothetical protein [Staphylococcus aureus]
ACGNSSSLDNQKNASNDSDSKSGGYKPKELTVQFVPSQNAGTSEAMNGYRRGAYEDMSKGMNAEEKSSTAMQGVKSSDWLSTN